MLIECIKIIHLGKPWKKEVTYLQTIYYFK